MGRDQKLLSNILIIVNLCKVLKKSFVVFNFDGIKSTFFFPWQSLLSFKDPIGQEFLAPA